MTKLPPVDESKIQWPFPGQQKLLRPTPHPDDRGPMTLVVYLLASSVLLACGLVAIAAVVL